MFSFRYCNQVLKSLVFHFFLILFNIIVSGTSTGRLAGSGQHGNKKKGGDNNDNFFHNLQTITEFYTMKEILLE